MCQLEYLQSYSYADLAKGLTGLCTVITENAVIGACSAFTDCLGKVEMEKLDSHYMNPKFLCKLLARTAACAAWSASTCLPSNATAKTSFENIMQEWYSKCPNIDLPYSSCNQTMTCMQAVSPFKGYSGTSVVDICPHMKSVMTCLKNALGTCSIKLALNYGFTEMAAYFEQTCNILKNPANTALKDCNTFDSCIRQISNPDQAKMPTVYPDPRYWCGVIRDTATCAFKSADGCNMARNSELKKDSADVVNSVSTKCPIDGFQNITFQVAAAPSMFTSASVITILIAFLSPVLL
ncbi:uncharacterized protein LOC121385649 [Gigantopelta aegis]|uniref:uncharacterized protein LOC121385649 n=1 Tax=Gigantopelta aegis TaxID=1735272 RepID=UPI001B88D107|nr:uncharacterized protein LOC121385649 [Gigantopelta aegis]